MLKTSPYPFFVFPILPLRRKTSLPSSPSYFVVLVHLRQRVRAVMSQMGKEMELWKPVVLHRPSYLRLIFVWLHTWFVVEIWVIMIALFLPRNTSTSRSLVMPFSHDRGKSLTSLGSLKGLSKTVPTPQMQHERRSLDLKTQKFPAIHPYESNLITPQPKIDFSYKVSWCFGVIPQNPRDGVRKGPGFEGWSWPHAIGEEEWWVIWWNQIVRNQVVTQHTANKSM